MTKNEFYERIKDGVLENLRQTDPSLEAIINSVTKINNVVYTGLSFRSDNSRISPVVYLDDFFQRYSEEDLSIDDIVTRVSEIYKTHAQDAQDINVCGLTEYDTIREQIVPAICNSERCTEYLKNAPHESLCDLSVYYRLLVDIGNDGEGSVLVNSNLMKLWGISYDELKEQAWNNIRKYNPPSFHTMSSILKEMMPGLDDDDSFDEDLAPGMNVLSNTSKCNGAIYMADTETLRSICDEMDSDLILLPSSRHEIIILPFSMADTLERCNEMQLMVSEINATTVSSEDYLSDSVYSFVRERGTIEKVA